MSASDYLRRDLEQHLLHREVAIIAGCGVSIAATSGARAASWNGLLELGVERCQALGKPLPPRWAERVREEIASPDLDDKLAAAEKIARKLGAPEGPEYRTWLKETVGALRVVDPAVPTALAALQRQGALLCTTNYDGVLEQASGLQPATWRERWRLDSVLRGEEPAVLHLHGHFQDPASVVLGIRSYEEVMGDELAQHIQRALRTMKTLLFVGFGAGLDDPNWAALRAWASRLFAESAQRHFRLERDNAAAAIQEQHGDEERIFVLGYGPRHADLGPFLRGLAPQEGSAQPPAAPGKDEVAEAVAVYRGAMARHYRRIPFDRLAARAEDRQIPEGLERLSLFLPQKVRWELPPQDVSRGVPRPPQPEPVSPLTGIADDILEHALRDERRALYLGAPGAGKTEMTCWVAARLCNDAAVPLQGLEGRVPVRIELARFDEWHRKQGGDFLAYLDWLHENDRLPLRGEVLRRLAAADRLLWLFDGVDEVREGRQRDRYLEMIAGLAARGRVVVTARIVGSEKFRQRLMDEGFAVYTLQDFTPEQVQEFIVRWHERAFAEDRERGERRRQRLERTLAESEAVRELTRNPLLLTLIALLNRGDELPRRRHLIYERALDLMVSFWEANKDLPEGRAALFEREDKLRYLRELALSMQRGELPGGQENRIPAADLKRFTVGYAEKRLGMDQDRAGPWAEALIQHLRERNYVLAWLGGEDYGFVHKTFLEALAAEGMVRLLDEEQRVAIFREHWRDGPWLEVLTLTCGLLDDIPRSDEVVRILQALLAECALHPYVALRLDGFAIRCLAEVRQIQQEPLRSLALWQSELVRTDVAVHALDSHGSADLGLPAALRFFGPRWPDQDRWRTWRLPKEVPSNPGAEALVMRCKLAAGPAEERASTLLEALRSLPVNPFWIRHLVDDAARHGRWGNGEIRALMKAAPGLPREALSELARSLHETSDLPLGDLIAASEDDDLTADFALIAINSNEFALALPVFFRRLESSSPRARAMACQAFGFLLPTSRDVLDRIKALSSTDPMPSVRAFAAQALLARGKREAAREVALQLLDEEDEVVREVALGVLQHFPETRKERLHALLGELPVRFHMAGWFFVELKSQVDEPELQALLLDLFKRQALPSLLIADLPFREALVPVWERLAREHPESMSSLVWGDQEPRSSLLPHLQHWMHDPADEALRFGASLAASAIANLTHEGRATIKELAFHARSERIRLMAARQLEENAALESLVRNAESESVRHDALLYLSYTRTPFPIALLSSFLDDPAESVVKAAAIALLDRGTDPEARQAAERRLRALATSAADEQVRLDAALAIKSPPALARLAAEARNPKVRLRAELAIEQLRVRWRYLQVGATHRRRAQVCLEGERTGVIEEVPRGPLFPRGGSRFTYDFDYLRRPGARAVSLTLPLRAEPFESEGLHPFFENLLPEGALLDQVLRKEHLHRDDRFGILLSACKDCQGAVEIYPLSERDAE